MTTRLIRWFVGKYGVNMAEAANSDIASYASFNEFFTRAPATRPAKEVSACLGRTYCGSTLKRSDTVENPKL